MAASTNATQVFWFQYPLVDRVGFEGNELVNMHIGQFVGFSILWWIELVLRGRWRSSSTRRRASFSILWWIELVLRAERGLPGCW